MPYKNPEDMKAWREAHPEKCKQYRLKYNSANPDYVKAVDGKKYVKHRDHIRAVQAEYRENNPELIKEINNESHFKITVQKKCTAELDNGLKCNKMVTLRKDYKTKVCKECGTKLKAIKLPVSKKHTHGLKLVVV
jgi:coproporphyrinogen III oxidase